jgi:hypothetical protein
VAMDPRNGGNVKTLGIKLPDALHAQFALIASLDEISLGDAAVRAVEHYVQTKRAEPDFAERARKAARGRSQGRCHSGPVWWRGEHSAEQARNHNHPRSQDDQR